MCCKIIYLFLFLWALVVKSTLAVPVWGQCGGRNSPCGEDAACDRTLCDRGTWCSKYSESFWQCRPDESKVHPVSTWERCGGTAAACAINGPCYLLQCPRGAVCKSVDTSFWRCEPDTTKTQYVPLWGACGGTSSPCASNSPCPQMECIEGSTCQRYNDGFWQCQPEGSDSEWAPFVRVEGTKFTLNGKPFYFAGVNAYWLSDLGVGKGLINAPQVDAFFRAAQAHNVRVVRLWGFNRDGMPWGPDTYKEQRLRRMDYVIASASRYGIKLVITLGNYWTELKGPEDYISTAYGSAEGRSIRDWYTDTKVIASYHTHLQYMASRTNFFTGVQNKDEPAIMAWGVTNEPRFPGASREEQELLVKWINMAAEAIKNVDNHHLVSAGADGLFANDGQRDYNTMNPGAGHQCEGADFVAISQLVKVDYGVIHVFPGLMESLPNEDPRKWDWTTCDWTCMMNWGRQWVELHQSVAVKDYGKPLVIEETGISIQLYTMEQRKQWMLMMTDLLEKSAKDGGSFAGLKFWCAAITGFTDYDGNTLYIDKDMDKAELGFWAASEGGQDDEEPVNLEQPIRVHPASLGTLQYTQQKGKNVTATVSGQFYIASAAGADAIAFRQGSKRLECSSKAASQGWRPAFKRTGVVDTTELARRAKGTSDLQILQDAGWAVNNL